MHAGTPGVPAWPTHMQANHGLVVPGGADRAAAQVHVPHATPGREQMHVHSKISRPYAPLLMASQCVKQPGRTTSVKHPSENPAVPCTAVPALELHQGGGQPSAPSVYSKRSGSYVSNLLHTFKVDVEFDTL